MDICKLPFTTAYRKRFVLFLPDGTVLLYDPRNMSKPLHRLEASPGHTVTGLHWQHCYQNIVTRSRISSSKSRTLAPAAAMAAKPLRAVDSEKKGMEGVGKKEPVLEPPPGTRIPVSIAQNATAGNPTYSAMRRHSGIGTGRRKPPNALA